MGVIYRLLFPSGKSYVGQTIRKPGFRWEQHRCAAASTKKRNCCRLLNHAIRKYGWHSVLKTVLAEVPDDKLNAAEMLFIDKFDAHRNGYNLTPGGECNQMHEPKVRAHHKQRLKETGHADRTSKAIKAYHADPKKHAAWLVNQQSAHRTAEHRAGQAERSKKLWAAEKTAGKDRGAAIRAALNDPAYKAKRAARRAADPREKARIAKVKATYAARKAAAHPGSQYAASCEREGGERCVSPSLLRPPSTYVWRG